MCVYKYICIYMYIYICKNIYMHTYLVPERAQQTLCRRRHCFADRRPLALDHLVFDVEWLIPVPRDLPAKKKKRGY